MVTVELNLMGGKRGSLFDVMAVGRGERKRRGRSGGKENGQVSVGMRIRSHKKQ
jgi:hypothetical protein